MLNSVAHVATKLWQWQVLHANLNAIDADANPRPTLYMCNQSATRYQENPTEVLSTCLPLYQILYFNMFMYCSMF